ncbi:acetylglutamate kinase [Methanocella conradii]|uniref:acetylglutamate kinase n=1 Tax=Methanocella conradii TaxID=1175444 RepID=UPI00157C5EA6|nr:acetylglutamate kinase [Methanocella conradii]
MEAGESFADALPWLKKYSGAVIVVKVGGHAMVDPEARSGIIKDIVTLKFLGLKPVIVHGGGPEIDAMMKRMGKTPQFVSGFRVTDDETLEIVRMVLVGNVNTDIVSLIARHGGKGVGIIGNDGNFIVARKKAPEKVVMNGKEVDIDYGWVGETESINPGILSLLLENGYIPAIAPIGYDAAGNCFNLNADTAAGDIAVAIKATSLVSLTDVDGVMMDPKKKETLIPQLSVAQCYELINKGVVSRGMIPKILSSISVIKGGIKSVHIINGNLPHALLQELFTDKGVGTCITLD